MKQRFTLLLLSCLAPLFLLAQAGTGTIRGKITDELGLGLPGANVYFDDFSFATVSNVNGVYTLVNVPVGSKKLNISFIGYGSVVQDIEVAAGQTVTFDVALAPGVEIGAEVLVLGDRLKGQAKALNQQRTNANITNIVAADQIGRFPDANIGDAMKRIPGITMQNDQGEARDIIIRGMAPQLNAVTLNGERIPSAEGDNRRVQMDLIPADMIQTIEVNKAVLPDMDADAIGGSVNLVTRKAPNGLRLSGTAASGYSLITDKPIWTGSLIVGDRIANGKLGIIVSGSYNNVDYGSDNVEAVWVETDAGVVIDELDIRKYLVQRVRRSASINLDYAINANHNIAFSGMYNWRDDWESRFRMRVSRLEDAFEDGEFTQTGPGQFTANARVEYQTKGGLDSDRIKSRRLEDQRMYNYTLSGEHLFNKLKATWNLTWARASEERPNERYISFRKSNQMVDVDLSNPRQPFAYLSNRMDNRALGLNEITENYNYTEDQDLNGRLDFSLPYSNSGLLKFGGRFRIKDKFRDNNFFEYEPLTGSFDQLGDVPFRDESNPDYLAGSQYQIGEFATPEFLGNLDLNNPALFEESDVPGEYVPGNYSANENIYAAYLMADHKFSQKFSAIFGLRYEYTDLEYTGNVFDLDEETTVTDQRTNSYGNFLPGIHLKYDFNRNTILRAAWTNTIARPNYFDLVPYAEFSPQDQELARGNPDLLATTAMNFDLMAERYFNTIGLVSLGGFYKNLDNFIYVQTQQNFSDPQFGDDLEFTRPLNGGAATVAGFEVSFQRQLWKGLGLYTNYTFTSSTTEGIEGREKDELSLPGTAEHMFNASLSYETAKLVVRVSLNYASGYIDELGGESFEDRFYDEQTFLDVNASYAITPNFRLFAEGNNLTNQPLRFYQGIRSRTMQSEFYNARFNFGLKFDLFGER
jgi:TonB-dependent receptor